MISRSRLILSRQPTPLEHARLEPHMRSRFPRVSATVADPSAPAYIAGVMIVESAPLVDANGSPRMDEIQARIERRLSRLPQLKRRAHFPGPFQGRPVWVDDGAFMVDHHIRQGTVDPPGDEKELLAVAERILRGPLDPTHPPWELWLLTGLASAHIAILIKLHHAIADGLGAVAIMTTLFDLAPDATDPEPALWTPTPLPSARALLSDNLAGTFTAFARALSALRHPRQIADLATYLRRTVAMSFRAPRTSFNRPIPSGSSSGVRVLHIDLEQARASAHAAGGKINDLVLALAAGGLRELLLGRGERVSGERLYAMVLVTLRSAADAHELGNQAGFVVIPLPVGEVEAASRLRLIAGATRHEKAEQRAAASQMVGAGSVASSRITPLIMSHQRMINLVATNVPGPSVPFYFLGARIVDAIPLLGGLLGGNVTICFCALSYAGRLNVTVIADARTIPDLDRVLRGMRCAWLDLSHLTMPDVTVACDTLAR